MEIKAAVVLTKTTVSARRRTQNHMLDAHRNKNSVGSEDA